MAGFFDDLFDEEESEEDYIDRVVPWQARDLWDQSVIGGDRMWRQYSSEDHMYLADLFAYAVVSGDYESAEEFTEYLEIYWDEYDDRTFYEAYEMIRDG